MVFINAYSNKDIAIIPRKIAMLIIIGLGSKHGLFSHASYSSVFKDFTLSDLLYFDFVLS
jgi:hypothetical protein